MAGIVWQTTQSDGPAHGNAPSQNDWADFYHSDPDLSPAQMSAFPITVTCLRNYPNARLSPPPIELLFPPANEFSDRLTSSSKLFCADLDRTSFDAIAIHWSSFGK
jgi:hypothetical protein